MHNILKVEELEYFSILSDNSQVSFVTTLPDLSFSLSSLLLWAGSSGDFTCALGLGSAFKSSVAEISPPPCSSSGLVWHLGYLFSLQQIGCLHYFFSFFFLLINTFEY